MGYAPNVVEIDPEKIPETLCEYRNSIRPFEKENVMKLRKEMNRLGLYFNTLYRTDGLGQGKDGGEIRIHVEENHGHGHRMRKSLAWGYMGSAIYPAHWFITPAEKAARVASGSNMYRQSSSTATGYVRA